MESTTVKLYSLNYGNVRTYLAASLFIGYASFAGAFGRELRP